MKKELINLLEKNHYSFNPITTTVRKIGIMPKETIFAIYKRRLLTSDKVNNQLIENIKLLSENKIRLSGVKDINNGDYIVFTNKNISNFIGIISVT